MSFSFNFELETGNHDICKSMIPPDGDKSSNGKAEDKTVKSTFEVKIFYDESVISKLEMKKLILNECALNIVDTSHLEHLLANNESFRSSICNDTSLGDIVSHSDLVDGVYEGGLKVWECGIDLANFLSSKPCQSSIKIAGKKVLELGCGAGLPGLLCLRSGASCVHFQDFNEEVLKLLTHVNVENNKDVKSQSVCRFFAGDWGSFCEQFGVAVKFDLILSAETIYNTDHYHKLHNIFDKMLSEDGVILIAAKVYYFGVGGSVDAFEEFLSTQDMFDYDTVWETKTGVPRKILKLQRQSNTSKEDKT